MTRGTAGVTLLLALSLLSASLRAEAQPAPGALAGRSPDDPAVRAEAQRHFDDGVRLLRERDWAGALRAFEASQSLRPTPSVLFNIAGCQRALGRSAEARRTYQRFLVIGSRPDQRAQATQAVAELASAVATLTVTADVADAELRLDGRPLVAQPVDLDVGTDHVVEARREGYRPASAPAAPRAAGPFTIALRLEPIAAAPLSRGLDVRADAPPTSPGLIEPSPERAASPPARHSGGSAWPWVLAGAAVVVAGAAVGTYFLLTPEPVPRGDMNVEPR